MQNPYTLERKKHQNSTSNKWPLKHATDFLAFIQIRCNSKENGRGANWFNYNKIDDKGSDKIFNHTLCILIDYAGVCYGKPARS